MTNTVENKGWNKEECMQVGNGMDMRLHKRAARKKWYV